MKLLTAINRCMKNAGDGTVNDVGSTDPKASHAQATIKDVLRELESRGYEFNTNIVTLTVDTNGKVPVSKTYLKVRLPSGLSLRHDSTDNRFVWDLSENDWHDTEITEVRVVFLEDEFTNLEDDIAQWVAWEATGRYWSERRQTDPPKFIEVPRMRAETHAMNSMNSTSLHLATGWDRLRNVHAGGADVNIDGDWITV